MTVGADTEAVTTTLRTISPDPRRARGQHVPRGVERVVRPASAPRAERRLPADGDGRRSDERDHVDRRRCASKRCGRPICCSATTPGARSWIAAHRARQARSRAAARPRRPMSSARAQHDARPSARSWPPPTTAPQRVRLRFLPDGNEVRVPERDADLRRRELERDRDRFHLRRPRDLQEVQGPDRVGRGAGRHRRSAGVHHRRAPRGLAAGMPRRRAQRPRDRGATAPDPAEGRAGRASAAT